MPEHLSSNLCIVTVFLSRSRVVLVSKLLPKVGHNLAQPIQASCMPMRKSTMVVQTDKARETAAIDQGQQIWHAQSIINHKSCGQHARNCLDSGKGAGTLG